MASLVIAGDTSGTITLAAPAVAGTTTITLPTTSGTVLTSASTITPSAGTVTQASLSTNVAGNGPAFRAYQATLQSISDNTFTKLTLNTEVFDTNSNYDTSTYRFTPTVSGYYFISGTIYFNAANQYLTVAIYKNGSQDARGTQSGNGLYIYNSTVTALIYLNGSTDYVELYGYQNSGTAKNTESGASLTYFQAFLARSA